MTILPSPFRLKIVLLYGAVLLATLLTFRLVSVGIVRESLYAEVDESLRAEVIWMRDLIRSYRQREIPDTEIQNEITQRSRLSPRKEFIEIYDRHGQEYVRSPNLGPDTLRSLARRSGAGVFEPVDVVDSQRRSLRILGLGEEDYEFFIGYPLTDLEASVESSLTSFLYLIPLAVALAIGGGFFLVSRFLAPIRRLDRYAEDLVALPLDQDLPAPPRGPRDEIERLVARIHDIVGRMRAGLRRSLGFSSLASHELRTPLAVVRSQLEDALRENASEEELRRAISATYDEVLRLERVVDDLLSLAAIEARTIRLALEPRDLSELVAEFAQDAALLCDASGVHFRYVRGPAVVVNVDADRLRQVLFNLLDNALKHTPPDGAIELALRRESRAAVLVLGDTGEGIAAEHMDRIFDPFFRPPGGHRRGVGVGLALVRWLAEAHGGTVEVDSRVGAGTTFTIRLPGDTNGPPQ